MFDRIRPSDVSYTIFSASPDNLISFSWTRLISLSHQLDKRIMNLRGRGIMSKTQDSSVMPRVASRVTVTDVLTRKIALEMSKAPMVTYWAGKYCPS